MLDSYSYTNSQGREHTHTHTHTHTRTHTHQDIEIEGKEIPLQFPHYSDFILITTGIVVNSTTITCNSTPFHIRERIKTISIINNVCLRKKSPMATVNIVTCSLV